LLSRKLVSTLAVGALLVSITACASTPIHTPGTPNAAGNNADLGPDDGYLETGEWVKLTDSVPAITNLDESLRTALAEAQAAAVEREIEFSFTAGWRSERYQAFLFDQAVAEYGSETEASRWVLPPDQSEHVHGKAVDVATADAMDWLTRFGAEFGLCQTYANESWHYEYIANANGVCPPQFQDSSRGA
jgi:hypothetical protein